MKFESKYRDQDFFIEQLKPFLEKENLPTDEEFIERLSDAFIDASYKLIRFRAKRARENITRLNKVNVAQKIK